MVVADEGEHLGHQRDDVSGSVVACQKEIEAGAAAHWSEVDGFGAEVRVIS